VSSSVLYLAILSLGCLMVLTRRQASKDSELLVLGTRTCGVPELRHGFDLPRHGPEQPCGVPEVRLTCELRR
jgi:hypothetical protein